MSLIVVTANVRRQSIYALVIASEKAAERTPSGPIELKALKPEVSSAEVLK